MKYTAKIGDIPIKFSQGIIEEGEVNLPRGQFYAVSNPNIPFFGFNSFLSTPLKDKDSWHLVYEQIVVK